MAATSASRPALRMAGNSASSAMASEASSVSGVMPVTPFRPQQAAGRVDGQLRDQFQGRLDRESRVRARSASTMRMQHEVCFDFLQGQRFHAVCQTRGKEILERQETLRALRNREAKARYPSRIMRNQDGSRPTTGMPLSAKEAAAFTIRSASRRASSI